MVPAPTREGFAFMGWYASKSALGTGDRNMGDPACTPGASSRTPPVRRDTTYYAHWRLAEPKAGKTVSVRSFSQFQYGSYGQTSGTGTKATAKEQDGSYRYDWKPTYVRWVRDDEEGLSYLEEYCGDYWWDFPVGFSEVTKGVKAATIDGDPMVPNQWYGTSAQDREVWIFDVDEVTLTWDANGGTVGGSATSSVEVAPGTKSMVPAPTRYGYAFSGWYEKDEIGKGDPACTPGDGNRTPPIRRDTTYYAAWTLITSIELPITASSGVAFELGVPDGEVRVAGTQDNPQSEAEGGLRSVMPVDMAVTSIACEPAVDTDEDVGPEAGFWRDHAGFADVSVRPVGAARVLSVAGGQILTGSAESPLLTIPAATGKEDGTMGQMGELELLYGLSLGRLFDDPADGGGGVDIVELLPQGDGSGFAVPQGLVRLVFTVDVASDGSSA